MGRIDPRVLLLTPLLLLAGGCGDDPAPVSTPSLPVVASAPPSAGPSSSLPAEPDPESTESVYVEEEDDPAPEPTAADGDLSDQGQSFLDQALGIELVALEGAPAEAADSRRKALDKLPDNPSKVLAALKNYVWYSPEARALYDKAVKAG